MPCKRRTKLQGRAKNTRKGCSITQIQQPWICQWLPGLQHTWKQAEAVTDKVLANQTSIWKHNMKEFKGTRILVEHLPHV